MILYSINVKILKKSIKYNNQQKSNVNCTLWRLFINNYL